jgi:hypothetical protein
MVDQRFDSFIKTLSRRGALQTLGAGALATALGRSAGEHAEAKKKRTKKGKKGDVNKRCKSQIGGCINILTPACADDEVCLATVQRCCPVLGTCNFASFLTCLEANAT